MGSGGASLGTHRNGPSPRRQLRNRRPTAGITLVVMMRLSGLPSGGAHRLVLGGNSGARHVCQRMQSHSVRTHRAAIPRDSSQGSIRTRAAVPSGRRRPGSTFGGQPPEPPCSMPESRLSWRWKERRVFSREDAVVTSATDWRRLQTGHAERASPTCRGVRLRHVPSSEGGERRRCCWG